MNERFAPPPTWQGMRQLTRFTFWIDFDQILSKAARSDQHAARDPTHQVGHGESVLRRDGEDLGGDVAVQRRLQLLRGAARLARLALPPPPGAVVPQHHPHVLGPDHVLLGRGAEHLPRHRLVKVAQDDPDVFALKVDKSKGN